MANTAQLKDIATQVRRDILRMIHAVQSGHPGGSLGCTDFLTTLYFNVMNRKDGFDLDGKEEDLFFLSNGHTSALFYSVLAHAGYFDVKELATFRKLNSRLQGHPTTHEHLPGVRVASGSLGQGLSVAIGAAIAKKLNKDNNFVFCLTGDGELEEGQNWEAIMFAAHNKVDNLIAAVDFNGLQIDGTTDEVAGLADIRAKFEAFNWIILEVNGHDYDELIAVLNKAKTLAKENQKPVCILLKTIMGKGVDFMEGKHHWHGTAPSDEQLKNALAQLPETLGDY